MGQTLNGEIGAYALWRVCLHLAHGTLEGRLVELLIPLRTRCIVDHLNNDKLANDISRDEPAQQVGVGQTSEGSAIEMFDSTHPWGCISCKIARAN
jgi:hypothetical protein